MNKIITKNFLKGKQVDCFSCKYSSGDFGCFHPDKMDEAVGLPGLCDKWVEAKNINEPFYTLKGPSPTRKEMRWKTK